MNEINRIISLSNAFGPSGFEEDVSAAVESELKDIYQVERDHMSNVTCMSAIDSTKPTVMFDAHLDEVGVIMQAVKPNGTLRFLTLGRWQESSFPSSSFQIRDKNGNLHQAVVAVKPPHFMSAAEKAKPLDIDDMVLDPGTCSKEETEALGIGIGSPAVPDVTCDYDETRKVFYGKAFDCRIGAAAAIETMRQLKGLDLPCNAAASFSAQEEVGERGVLANARKIHPDVMICFEGCPADDTFSEDYMVQSALHQGPMLRHMDVSMITNWRFQKLALDTAHALGIPVQESVRKGGGTNGAKVNETYAVPAIVIGIPVRYIHSSNCWAALDDYQNAVKLAVELTKILSQETVAAL